MTEPEPPAGGPRIPERPPARPLFVLAISVPLAAATGLLTDWPTAVTVLLTTMALFTVREIH